MSRVEQLEKTKKHLRSVLKLISEKGGVALDRLERDYKELVRVDSYSYNLGHSQETCGVLHYLKASTDCVF